MHRPIYPGTSVAHTHATSPRSPYPSPPPVARLILLIAALLSLTSCASGLARLTHVSSSNFPHYQRHPNLAGPRATLDPMKKAEQTLFCGDDCPSILTVTLGPEGGNQ